MDVVVKILRIVLIVVIYAAICWLVSYLLTKAAEQYFKKADARSSYQYGRSYSYTPPRTDPYANETSRERKIRLLRAKAASSKFPHEAAAFNAKADQMATA